MTTLYDEVEYPSRAFSQTHPERAAAIATLVGLTPPDPSTARVLEVGCGSGWNLIPMAGAMPHANFTGFDLAGSAIDAAVRDKRALGLNNLQFEHLDMMDFATEAGPFDYIIAHGFYSWVPQPVRLKLLEVCQRHLSPDGIAFISFNADPYGRIRRMWREMLQYHIRQNSAVSPAAQIALSESFLTLLRDQWARKDRLRFHATLLDGQIGAIRSGGGNWFFHDDLGPVFEPLRISRFCEELKPFGLRFAAEALFDNLSMDELPGVIADGKDWITREQTRDDFVFRGFHSALVCRLQHMLKRPFDRDAFAKLRYSAPLTRVSPTLFRNDWTGSEAETSDSATVAVLQRLAEAWPDNRSFAELDVPPETLEELVLAQVIEASVMPRQLPRASTPQFSDAPRVWDPARLQARRGKVVTNRLHAAIQLEQEPLRQFVIGLDGTRPLSSLRSHFLNEQEMFGQLEWLHRAALIH